MGAKSEALARQLEAKVQAAVATVERLSDAEWTQVTEAERWSVGVTAHHIAGVLEPLSEMIKAVVAGQPSRLTGAMVDEMNAQHATDHARCTKAETIALLQRGARVAASVIRSLSAEQLATKGTVLADAPPMSAEELVTAGLLAHLDEHFGSIRRTVGHD
jgi:DinB superfamily